MARQFTITPCDIEQMEKWGWKLKHFEFCSGDPYNFEKSPYFQKAVEYLVMANPLERSSLKQAFLNGFRDLYYTNVVTHALTHHVRQLEFDIS